MITERGLWTVPGIPFILGATHGAEDVDSTARRAAAMLDAAFPGQNVELRFNSDRRSGGAFVNGVLKLGCGLRKVRPEGLTDTEWYDYPMRDHDALPDELVCEVGIMSDPTAFGVTPNHGTEGRRYYHAEVANLETGLAFLLDHQRPA